MDFEWALKETITGVISKLDVGTETERRLAHPTSFWKFSKGKAQSQKQLVVNDTWNDQGL